MTTDDGGADDPYWRRPDPTAPETDGGRAGPGHTGPDRDMPAYTGPPVGTPPPPGWRPPLVVNPAPPGSLPRQDLASIDGEERNARTVTYGIGMIAAAIMIILTCLLCSRVLF